ncbi:EF-hand calcium-binding domain-containing protein 9 [Clydaea vesicula]|uniref:EF-hand calcium-binding domain-containing protein 9 n=1 Tax=Clydaea vesicula TaxID=447962 RepID=A0AAD5UBU3_9FUNG|nr:EF-hand calcium-binding domain-containing protein 9 [Clydaea vesicula]
MLDWKGEGSLDDIQFLTFMETVTDLNRNGSLSVFDIFDLDRSGSVEFDEFYLLICILVAVSNGTGKQFMFQHWRTCFELLDEDGSKASKNILTLLYLNKMGIVSKKEFETLGFLFNFSSKAVDQIYKEFDLNGNSV